MHASQLAEILRIVLPCFRTLFQDKTKKKAAAANAVPDEQITGLLQMSLATEADDIQFWSKVAGRTMEQNEDKHIKTLRYVPAPNACPRPPLPDPHPPAQERVLSPPHSLHQ